MHSLTTGTICKHNQTYITLFLSLLLLYLQRILLLGFGWLELERKNLDVSFRSNFRHKRLLALAKFSVEVTTAVQLISISTLLNNVGVFERRHSGVGTPRSSNPNPNLLPAQFKCSPSGSNQCKWRKLGYYVLHVRWVHTHSFQPLQSSWGCPYCTAVYSALRAKKTCRYALILSAKVC